jgi:hypothetical protein
MSNLIFLEKLFPPTIELSAFFTLGETTILETFT